MELGQLTFQISDDGRGIDWGAIAERAKSKGLPHSSRGELLDALCADGITTRATPSEISGRGIGMAALRERLAHLSGQLEVRSTVGAGTTWFMRFRWPVRMLGSAVD